MKLLQTFAWLLLAAVADSAVQQKTLNRHGPTAEPLPSLLDATLLDLTTALEEGKLSSVNLTKVAHLIPLLQIHITDAHRHTFNELNKSMPPFMQLQK